MKPVPLTAAHVARWMKRAVMRQHREALSTAWETGGRDEADRVTRDTAEKLKQINNLFKLLKLP